MAAGVGSLIEKADYDTIKAKVDLVFGTGSGQTGYGQAITSPAVSAGSVISASQWLALRNDMVKARQHQTGTAVGTSNATDGANLLLPTSGGSITEALRNQFNLFSNTITSDKFLIGAAQFSDEGLITGTRSTAWNGTLTQTVTLSSTADNMRHFFNAGGKIRVSANRSGGSSSSKNTTWDTMFSQMGEFVMDYTQTTFSGSSATGSAIGWYDLTTSNQLIGQKAAPSGSYAENRYFVFARTDAGLTQLILTIEFRDLDAGDPNIDENVDGTLNSVISQYRPSGSNVSVSSLIASGTITGGATVTPPPPPPPPPPPLPPPPTPTYAVTPSASSVNEGSSVTFNVITTNVANGTTLFWAVPNPAETNTNDFIDNISSGSFVINNNAGTIVRGISADSFTEGTERFSIAIRTGSTSGPTVATSTLVTINDTSLTPPPPPPLPPPPPPPPSTPTYSLTPSIVSVNEGDTITISVNTTNVPNGTILYWRIIGDSGMFDFGPTSGGFNVNNNFGSFSTNVIADNSTEGTEFNSIRLYTDSSFNVGVGNNVTVSIVDTSTTPPPTYAVTPAASSVNEGGTVTFNVNTTRVDNGTTLYWTATNAGDLASGSGSFTIFGDIGAVFVTPLNDSTTEGAETFTVSIRTGSTSGPIVATSSSVTINDTSTTPPTYSITNPSPNVISEGSGGTFTVNTTNVANGTVLYWTITPLTTNLNDFSNNSGSFTINSNQSTFTIFPTADETTEGQESFQVNIRTGSTSGTIVATSSGTTVGDTSTTPPPPPPPPPTYSVSPGQPSVDEGSSVSFTVTTANVANGTTLYWTATNAGDFFTGSGSFTIDNTNVGGFNVQPIRDGTTEGAETFTVSIRTGSTSGPVVATSSSVTINDTSITPSFGAVGFSPSGTVSAGTSVTFSATIINGVGQSYAMIVLDGASNQQVSQGGGVFSSPQTVTVTFTAAYRSGLNTNGAIAVSSGTSSVTSSASLDVQP